jgi:ABC-type branched-subunit amino acid transport system substrate-binding protein
VSVSPAQDTAERERSLLLKNIDLYKTGRFAKAEENFSLIVTRLPNSPLITVNHLMLIKSQYKRDQYIEAINEAKRFLDTYPQSKYTDDVLFTVGNCYFRLQRFETAINAWLDALSRMDDARLSHMIGTLIVNTLRFRFRPQELENWGSSTQNNEAKILYALARAETHMEGGSVILAQREIESALNENPQTVFRSRMEQLLQTGSIQKENIARFALLLPFSGPQRDIASDIKEGIEIAANQFNDKNDISVQLVYMDYAQDMTRALRMYKELAQNSTILAVLGPLENDISAALAAISEYEQLPVFSPTASGDGITGLTDHFFQLNSTMGIRAKKLARYAIDSIQVKRFCTFSPVENLFIKMSEQFVDVMNQSGAELVSQEWYYPGDQDFNKQFMQMKRTGLIFAFRDSIWAEFPELDTLTVDSLYREYKLVEQEKLEETDIKVDSADIAVTTIDGVFIPIYKEDIPFMAPQIAYSNIQAQYLGNSDWYDVEQLKKNKNYINGIVFVSDGFVDEENWDFRNFRNIFREQFKKSPSQYHLIGYDSFRFMLSGLKSGQVFTREAFIKNVESIGSYDGIYRSVNLNDEHFNTNAKLLKYDYGQLISIQ